MIIYCENKHHPIAGKLLAEWVSGLWFSIFVFSCQEETDEPFIY